tara:strand:+ start:413 stop:811 length:399 start_codon:yes stop_codon:yes gene_type:complete
MKLIAVKPDVFGAIASSLCVVHCLATPLLFISHLYTSTGYETVPFWWKDLDFLFLVISFTAIYRSTKTTSKNFMKYALWVGWILLFSLILNEKIGWLAIPGILNYIAALSLASFHIYNLKFCQCDDDNCCAN